MVHIKLSTIKRQLQDRMHYPLTPEQANGYPTLDEAFDALLTGFGVWLKRNNRGSQATISLARKRGWLTEKDADRFTDYCITGWRVI